MLESLLVAVSYLARMDAILILSAGCVIGIVFGALPGLGCPTAIVMVMPFTFGWDPMLAMYLFTGIIGAEAFGGSIPAILINTPGTAVNAATCFDGHPMARRGESGRALGISALSSGLGALLGLLVILALFPILRRLVFLFSPPEFFILSLFGLVTVAFAARGSILKGLFSGLIGISLSLVGYSPVFGVLRLNFGSEYLWDGLPLVPFLIGMFAISELIHYSVRGGKIAEGEVEQQMTRVSTGLGDIFKNRLCFLRSAAIGTIIGMIPAVGGAVANLLSYTSAMQSSPHPEKFGTGLPEGVIAAEASNNASYAGALLPTLSLGIPGSVIMAVLLGAFILHGLVPGPLIIQDHMDIVFAIILGMVLGNLFSSTVGLLTARYLGRLTAIPVVYICPVVLVLCCAGAFSIRGNFWDVVLAIISGIFGYTMKRFGFSIVCLIIGYVLGVVAESAFHMSLMISRGSYAVFFTRPISLALLILISALFLLPLFNKYRSEQRGGK